MTRGDNNLFRIRVAPNNTLFWITSSLTTAPIYLICFSKNLKASPLFQLPLVTPLLPSCHDLLISFYGSKEFSFLFPYFLPLIPWYNNISGHIDVYPFIFVLRELTAHSKNMDQSLITSEHILLWRINAVINVKFGVFFFWELFL